METMPHSRDWRTRQRVDQAITDILTSTDEAERQELYDFVLTRLHEDAVYIPLTYETNKALYTSELKGSTSAPTSMMWISQACTSSNR